MNDKDVIVLGTLKKEKSSKPIFDIFVFVFLIGTCLAFPYIKALIGDDFTLDDLLNRNNNNTTSPVVTTSNTTTPPNARNRCIFPSNCPPRRHMDMTHTTTDTIPTDKTTNSNPLK